MFIRVGPRDIPSIPPSKPSAGCRPTKLSSSLSLRQPLIENLHSLEEIDSPARIDGHSTIFAIPELELSCFLNQMARSWVCLDSFDWDNEPESRCSGRLRRSVFLGNSLSQRRLNKLLAAILGRQETNRTWIPSAAMTRSPIASVPSASIRAPRWGSQPTILLRR